VACNLAVYPIYFIYICSLTMRQEQFRLNWLWLMPSITGCAAVGTCYLLMTEAETEQFIDLYLYKGTRVGLSGMAAAQIFFHDMGKVLFGLMIIPIFIIGRLRIQQFDQLVETSYADTEDKKLRSLHYMLIAFMVTSFSSIIFNFIGRQRFADSLWLIAIPATLFSVLLFAIGYIGHRQQFCIDNLEADEHLADDAVPPGCEPSELSLRIQKLMEQEQMFRQQNLKINDLVKRLGTNRNYVYMAINREIGISFAEYINRLRIEYAVKLIDSEPDRHLGQVAEESGFSSSSSFYRNFKVFMGVSPKEYQNKLKEKV
jgi:AraC-like DNA-binding protein